MTHEKHDPRETPGTFAGKMVKAVRTDRVKLVCGGQTGVDRAMLDYCLARGLPCGGWCPGDRMAEDGPIDAGYPVEPLPGASRDDRTAANVRDSDAIVIIYREPLAGGTLVSHEIAMHMKKPCLLLNMHVLDFAGASSLLQDFFQKHRPGILNISGPRASEWPGGYQTCFAILEATFGK